MHRSSSLWAAAILLVAAACGGNGQLASRFVKSVPVTASQGATITVTAADEPELEGTTLVIPPGALAFDTTITLEVGEESIVSGGTSAGPVAIWGPSGLVFHKPARMTLPYELPSGRSDGDLFVHVLEADGRRFNIEHNALHVDSPKNELSFDVDGFTAFQPGTVLADGGRFTCTSNAQCGTNQVCVNGACQASGVLDAGCASGQCGGNDGGTTDAGCAAGRCGGGGNDGGATDAGCAAGRCGGGGNDGGTTDAGCATGQCGGGGNDGGTIGGGDAGCALGTSCALDAGSGGNIDGGSGPLTCSSNLDCGTFQRCLNGFCI